MRKFITIMLIAIGLIVFMRLDVYAVDTSEINLLLKRSSDYSKLMKQKEAIEKLKQHKSQVVPTLVGIVGSPTANVSIRLSAIRILAKFKEQQAVKPLMEVAKEEDSCLRYTAIQALGIIGDKRAVHVLINALISDPDKYVRRIAATFLGREIYTPEAKNVLLQSALKDQDTEVRYKALNSLKGLIYQKIIPREELFDHFVKILKEDDSGDVKGVAALCLAKQSKAISSLLDALKANCAIPFNKRAAKEDIHYQGHGHRIGEGLTLSLIGAIESNGKEVIPILLKELSQSQGDYKYSIVLILAKLSKKLEYSREVKDYVPIYQFDQSLLPICVEALQNCSSGKIRASMAWILGEYKYTDAIPALRDALVDEYTIFSKEGIIYPVRQAAREALKKLGMKP
jgi:HEAT repeat protein